MDWVNLAQNRHQCEYGNEPLGWHKLLEIF